MHPMSDRRITLEHLRAFVAIADKGGFQHAGLELNRTQSAVTQSLRKLEDYLNCQLLERRQGHVLGMTREGERFLPEAREILARLDNVVSIMQQPEIKGHIALGIPDSFNTTELQRAIAHCLSMNSGLRVQVTAALSAQLAEMLEQGALDVTILQQHVDYREPYGKAKQRVLKEERLCWVASNLKDFVGMEELPLVMFAEGCLSYRSAALHALERAGRRYYFSFVSASYDSVRNALSSGFGVGVLPESEIGTSHVILTAKDGLPPLPRVQIVIRTKTLSLVIRQFSDLITRLPEFSSLCEGKRSLSGI
jgi:DNA-binding transcriptional LysR family regulator